MTDTASGMTIEELSLGQAWKDVLHLDRLGRMDDFFDLGGDSLLAVRLVARAHELGLELRVRDVFEAPVFGELALRVATRAPRGVRSESGLLESPLTPEQRAYFELGLERTAPHFSESLLRKANLRLDSDAFDLAVRDVVVAHSALRLRFRKGPQGWRSFVLPIDAAVNDVFVREQARSAPEIRQLCDDAHLRLGVRERPVFQVALIDLGPLQPQLVFIVAHHLVFDGLCWQILLDDLAHAYALRVDGQAFTSPAATTPFHEWAGELEAYGNRDAVHSQLPYWLQQADEAPPRPPRDAPGENTLESVETVYADVDGLDMAPWPSMPAGVSVDEIMLASLASTIGELSGDTKLHVLLAHHGRLDSLTPGIDVTRTIGRFTFNYPLLIEGGAAPADGATLDSVRAALRRLPDHGIGHGLLRWHTDERVRESMRAVPGPYVSFSYQGRRLLDPTRHPLFLPVDLDVGEGPTLLGPRAVDLHLGLFFRDGKLMSMWRYSRNLHRRDTVVRLAARFATRARTAVASARRLAQ